jgi:glutathione peroxidase
MKKQSAGLLMGILGILGSLAFTPVSATDTACPKLLDHEVRTLVEGESVQLCERYGGQVVLVVNTASKCAYTPQYDGLEQLHQTYRDQGLVVLGFPSQDFGNQEFGNEEKIRDFCRMTYGVRFPMFAKTGVREGQADPLYQGLAEAAGRYPSWNFHKYLLSRDGELVADFDSWVAPDDPRLLQAVEAALQ